MSLLRRECREVLRAPVLWVICAVVSPLVGFSFIQAVNLYAEASGSARTDPAMARGLSPLDGILVPTFGAYYVVLTFLFPFLAIRAIGIEKQTGSLKLSLQLPVTSGALVGMKLAALLLAGVLMAIPGVSAVAIWALMGGHLDGLETWNLVLGYVLYALAIAGISFLAASVAETSAAAAVVALSLILGSWVLDFAGPMSTGWMGAFSSLSLTAALRTFERGLFAWSPTWRLLLMAITLLALAIVWLPPAHLTRRLRGAVAVVLAASIAALVGGRTPWAADVSQDGRNSFNPAEEQALKHLREPLRITVHLSPEDSRFRDLDRNVLARLRRLVPHLEVVTTVNRGGDLIGTTDEDDYGWIVYEYAGRRQRSTSNSEEEILSILHDLSGQSVAPVPVPAYPGYPLVADPGRWAGWFYGVLPALSLLGAWRTRRE